MYNLIATTTFGLEAIVKREANNLGFNGIKVQDGRVEFTGDERTIVESNIWFRCADRILIKVGEFNSLSFDELFEKTKALPWGDFIPLDGKFTVIGKSVKSQLFSVSDCQSIVKKAIVEKLKLKYKVDWFDETGADYKVQVGILKDFVTLTIDTSGTSLHKRGYRDNATKAPIKETLAAAMIDLSYYKKDKILLDPLCGSGTIPIEAALMAKNIAPGLYRGFACEKWDFIPENLWAEVRADAESKIDNETQLRIFASDLDDEAVEVARENAVKAGVSDCISFEVKDMKDIKLQGDYGVIICNPPYGERIGTLKEIEILYGNMKKVFFTNDTWSVYVITSYEEFEKIVGRRASVKRKLYNGKIKTDYYQFYGEKPKKIKTE